MITPRYHLITIVAIFFALGLGLLAGSSFGQPALVGQLQERTDSQLKRMEELRGEVDDARARADALGAFADAAVPLLIAGRLDGYRVVVVTQEGVPSGLEASVLSALEDAGALTLATLAAQPSLTGTEEGDAAALAGLLGSDAEDGGTSYLVRAGARLAQRLGTDIAPVDPEVDLLAELLAGGFLAARDGSIDDATRLEIHAGQLLVVVLGGTESEAEPLPTRIFAEALVRGLADAGVPVAAVEPMLGGGDAWVGSIADDPVVTVVGADEPSGVAALILGLVDRLRTGDGGAYGGDRAQLPAAP